MAKGFHFSGCGISSLIFSDVVLLAWSGDGLQLTLEWEAVGMRISTFTSEAIVLSWKRISWLLQVRVRDKLLPHAEAIRYLKVLGIHYRGHRADPGVITTTPAHLEKPRCSPGWAAGRLGILCLGSCLCDPAPDEWKKTDGWNQNCGSLYLLLIFFPLKKHQLFSSAKHDLTISLKILLTVTKKLLHLVQWPRNAAAWVQVWPVASVAYPLLSPVYSSLQPRQIKAKIPQCVKIFLIWK